MNKNYIGIYMPTHHRAMSNGIVYEHIIKAEEKLNRPLKDGETVHHINENKKDNQYKNLMVFRTNSDHRTYHTNKLFNLIENKDGSYSCIPIIRYCEYCNKELINREKKVKCCSIECSNKLQRRVKRPSAEQLKQELIKTNFVQVGKKYGVSDTAIRKWCKSYGMSTKAKDYK